MAKEDTWERFCEEYNKNEVERLMKTIGELKKIIEKSGDLPGNITAGEYKANLHGKCGG